MDAIKPEFSNTWGDGLYLVFDSVKKGANFALQLMAKISEIDWEKVGLPIDTTVRIGLHAGPVYPGMDPVINRTNYFGSHVNRAARIEPVTPPGCIYTSEQFAALLVVEPDHQFKCNFAGVIPLAKGYDKCPLYQLERK